MKRGAVVLADSPFQDVPGSKQRVEGAIQPGSRVAILDDVFTQGNSVLQAIREVELVGGKVVAAICIVDRLEGARDKLADHYYYLPIFTIRDLGIEPAAETGTS